MEVTSEYWYRQEQARPGEAEEDFPEESRVAKSRVLVCTGTWRTQASAQAMMLLPPLMLIVISTGLAVEGAEPVKVLEVAAEVSAALVLA